MEQNDLFAIFDETPQNNSTDTSKSNVTQTVTNANQKPSVFKPKKTIALDSDVPNILLFAHTYQKQMWNTFKHRRDCMMQVGRFANYKDYGIVPMDQITSRMIIEYRAYLQDQGELTNGTINRHLSAVSACYRFALEELQIIEDRPRVSLLKSRKPNTRAFTKEQVDEIVRRFREGGNDWCADMVILGCKTGMRQGEITSLNLDSIEWNVEDKEIYLPPKITKTGEGRMVSLAAEGAWDCALRLKAVIGREFTHRRFYDRWWDVKHDMGHGKDDWFKFHATRHTAATNMAKNQANSLTVAEQLGHSSVATTKKYYHGDAKARASAVAGL